jgi:hypothetical protein
MSGAGKAFRLKECITVLKPPFRESYRLCIKGKVKISLLQAMEAHRVARG